MFKKKKKSTRSDCEQPPSMLSLARQCPPVQQEPMKESQADSAVKHFTLCLPLESLRGKHTDSEGRLQDQVNLFHSFCLRASQFQNSHFTILWLHIIWLRRHAICFRSVFTDSCSLILASIATVLFYSSLRKQKRFSLRKKYVAFLANKCIYNETYGEKKYPSGHFGYMGNASNARTLACEVTILCASSAPVSAVIHMVILLYLILAIFKMLETLHLKFDCVFRSNKWLMKDG